MVELMICIVGMPGSGKSIISKAARDLELPVYNMGDVVREETLRMYGKITPELMRRVSRELREKYGPQVIALKTLEKIGSGTDIVVIDGVRSLDEINVFKQHTKQLVIVAVHASPRTRFERIRNRRRPGDPDNWDDFVKRDLVELSFGIGNVIALADYMIVNEGSIEEAYKAAKEILEGLIRNVRESRG